MIVNQEGSGGRASADSPRRTRRRIGQKDKINHGYTRIFTDQFKGEKQSSDLDRLRPARLAVFDARLKEAGGGGGNSPRRHGEHGDGSGRKTKSTTDIHGSSRINLRGKNNREISIDSHRPA